MKRNFFITVDPTAWALPLYIDWSRNRIFVNILCFEFNYLFVHLTVEPTLEEEMRQLLEFEKHQLGVIANWRAEIQKRMGEVLK